MLTPAVPFHSGVVEPVLISSGMVSSPQAIARFVSAPENPVISIKLSLVLEKPAVPSLTARKVRAVGPDPKEKVAAPFLAKLAVVRTEAIAVAVKALTLPSSLRLAAVTAVGPSRMSVPIVKSVMRSKAASLESARAKRKVSAPVDHVSVSAPAPPINVSDPSPPLRMFAAELPVRTLFSALPVPLMAAEPVSVRFSRFAPSV